MGSRRTAIAEHLGLTEGKSRRIAEGLLDLGILVTGGHEGSRGGYSVNRDNPWIVRRLVANRDARQAAELGETISAEQLAMLSMGCPVSHERASTRPMDAPGVGEQTCAAQCRTWTAPKVARSRFAS
jgi:hypothetical protein